MIELNDRIHLSHQMIKLLDRIGLSKRTIRSNGMGTEGTGRRMIPILRLLLPIH